MIKTDRLILRRITKEDVADIHVMNSFSEVERYNTIGIPKTIEDTAAILAKEISAGDETYNNFFSWVISLANDNSFLGKVGMYTSTEKYQSAEIHYSLHPDHWGKGYALEAVKAVIKWGFSNLHLHRIEAGVATQNLKSIKLLEAAGMTREGLCRQILPIRGEWLDNYQYAILASDLK